MLFIRIAPLYTKIFTDWPGDFGNFINFSADDAVYHMRFVHNTLHHFPLRVFFDPFTYFPFGSYIAFGPLFTLIIATAALIIGFGHPTPELINHVAAYIPPVMGMLCLIPLYFTTQKLFGKTTALLASFILAFLPGEFLSRSSLGFVDHHVAEVLFSTTTCAFLIYALNTAIHHQDSNKRSVLIYGLLAGITFGLFTLTWQGTQMFGVIFLLFFIVQLIIDHLKNNNTNYLLPLVILTYLPSAIMVLPYIPMHPHFEPTLYPLYITLTTPTMIAIFSTCYLWHLILKANKKTKYWGTLAFVIAFVLIFFFIKNYFPQVYAFISYGYNLLFHPTPGMNTVGEVRSAILDQHGKFTIERLWFTFFWTMPIAAIGLGCLIFHVYEKQRPTEVFLLIWSLAIVIATCAQTRFNYYLAINAAILAGFGIYYFLDIISYAKPQKKLYIRLQKIFFATFFSVFAFLIIDPILMLLMDQKIPSGIQISQSWYNTLMWLKKHTPNPQGKIIDKNFDYTNGYYPIPKNLNIPYNYPKSAYGVMSWWDVGHQITYIAERIPNSNNYQQGIVEKDKAIGAAAFFTTQNEEKAIKNLNKMGSKYIIIANDMVSHKFPSILVWNNDTKGWSSTTNLQMKWGKKTYTFKKLPIDSQKFWNSITSRLFYNDADGLQHFRLIYESDGDYLVTTKYIILKPSFRVIQNSISHYKTYDIALKNAKKINHNMTNQEGTVFFYNARPPAKETKIFEKVKGAVIRGIAPDNISDNTPVELSLKLKIKYKRTFNYKQTTKIINGKYQFIVAYPTTKMHGDGYSYDIQAVGDYQIKIKDQTFRVSVPEKSVMLGKTVEINQG